MSSGPGCRTLPTTIDSGLDIATADLSSQRNVLSPFWVPNCQTNGYPSGMTSATTPEERVSFRADPATAAALSALMATGRYRTRSEAARDALHIAAHEAERAELRAWAATVAGDPVDRAESAATLAFMEADDPDNDDLPGDHR